MGEQATTMPLCDAIEDIIDFPKNIVSYLCETNAWKGFAEQTLKYKQSQKSYTNWVRA